jgi:glutamate N-acetyltransferase / amino-acid N-acetyltransferase
MAFPSARAAPSRLAKQLQRRFYSAPGDGAIPPNKLKYVPTSGSYPQSFVCGATHVGVKPSNKSHDDLAMVASTVPCNAAAVFTQNRFQAAPVTVSKEVLGRRKGEGIRAVVVNSGCANAVTGKGGIEDAVKMGKETDRCFSAEEEAGGSRTVVMSTGVIGQRYVQFFLIELYIHMHAYVYTHKEREKRQS